MLHFVPRKAFQSKKQPQASTPFVDAALLSEKEGDLLKAEETLILSSKPKLPVSITAGKLTHLAAGPLGAEQGSYAPSLVIQIPPGPVDTFSGCVEAFPTTNRRAHTLAQILTEIILRFVIRAWNLLPRSPNNVSNSYR